MNGKFERVAIVTGGARGMGREMTLGLLGRGAAVVAADLHAEGLAELVSIAKERGHGDLLLPVQFDLSAPESAQKVVAAAVERFGKLDILVSNAGIGQAVMWPDDWKKPVKTWDIELHQWHTFFKVNADTHFLMTKAAIPLMLKQGWGRIVGVTTSLSSMLKRGVPYGPSKAAAEALLTHLARELDGTGITVNILIPGGLTNTNFVPKGAPFDLSKLIQPQVMVAPLLSLVSDEAANTTGMRFVAARWKAQSPFADNIAAAGAPIGWSTAGSEAVRPAREEK